MQNVPRKKSKRTKTRGKKIRSLREKERKMGRRKHEIRERSFKSFTKGNQLRVAFHHRRYTLGLSWRTHRRAFSFLFQVVRSGETNETVRASLSSLQHDGYTEERGKKEPADCIRRAYEWDRLAFLSLSNIDRHSRKHRPPLSFVYIQPLRQRPSTHTDNTANANLHKSLSTGRADGD